MDSAVGDVGPSTSPARKEMFLRMGPRMVEYLESKGMPFVRYGGWSDYHDDLPGGLAEGRSLGVQIFNIKKLGKERSDEHTSELQSLMRISYAVFCLKTKTRSETQ